MSYIEAIVLGLVQGLCEFLPVSSSGHLVIFQNLFGLSENASENQLIVVLLHVATLIAVVVAFHGLIWRLICAAGRIVRNIFTGKFSWKTIQADEKLLILMILSTCLLIPFVLISDQIEALFSSLLFVGVALLVTAFLLTLADYITRKYAQSGRLGKTGEKLTVKDSIVVGLFQCLALVPGISRSGSTITAGLLCGFDRKQAVEYSFILSLPAIVGSAVLKVGDAVELLPTVELGPYLVGMVVAAVSGYLAIKLVELVVKKDKFRAFAYYCAAAGILAIVYAIVTK